jgi:polyhydroxyalkanoate synthesis regulator phasin
VKTLGKWKVAIVGGLLVAAIASTAAVVAAQTPVPGTSTTGTSFLSRVAAKLGIDTGTLETAVKSSATDQVNEQVKAGTLTQAQADQILQRIQNAPADALGFGPGFGRGGHGPGDRGPGGFMDQAGLAQFLGITTDQLRTELQATNATLASVAQAHGKTADQLKAYLTTEMKTHLDQEVTEGDMTQAQADARLAQMTQNLDQMINSAPPAGHDGFGDPGRDGGMWGSSTPNASPTATSNAG